jgi:hypothetical protein
LSCLVRAHDGAYEIQAYNSARPVLRAIVAARIDHRWVKSSQYPNHQISQGVFHDELGHGQLFTVTSTGLAGLPDLVYMLRLYDSLPFGDIDVEVRNRTRKNVTVQAIRSLEAVGERLVDLGGRESLDRVLSDSFSENRPALRIYDLEGAPQKMHRAVGSQLVYNQESRQSLFLGALSSQRFLTIMHLEAGTVRDEARIDSLTVDSTGTTEIQSPAVFPDAPAESDRVELSLPISPGGTMASERLSFSVSNDYHSQLEAYGAAVRQLHHARVSEANLMGWWSWTALYRGITDGNLLTNAQWLTQHLKAVGYDYFHIDSGYEYAPGEFTTANAARFPRGVRALVRELDGLGLRVSLWTAPFYVGERSWVYEHHRDWLVHNARGQPIRIMRKKKAQEGQDIFVLDTTHPGAQQYLRSTYRRLKEWGIRHFKFDFMDDTAIEGYYHRPDTTALEAQRLGLEIIREAVGDDVLLDKDGSPMLNPVGLVDEGRISQDTAHIFWSEREAASGIAARYYMHRNFFVSDPDAFTISRQVVGPRVRAPLTVDEAKVSIVLAAVSGGMFEIGDDLPTLGSDPQRLALLTNPNLLQMIRLGRASKPLDLMSYRTADEQPSIFLLREDARQAMLAVFNWTEQPQSHSFKLAEFVASPGHSQLYDALAEDQPVAPEGDAMVLKDQPPHSVRLIKIIDVSRPPAPPGLATQVPTKAQIGEEVRLSVAAQPDAVPLTAVRWNFGDGIIGDGASLTHTYTHAGTFTVNVEADGVDGLPARATFPIAVNGMVKIKDPYRYNEANEYPSTGAMATQRTSDH